MISALRYDVENIGGIVKSSKKRFTWIFEIDEMRYKLQLEFSYMSGKRRITLDGKTLYESTIVL